MHLRRLIARCPGVFDPSGSLRWHSLLGGVFVAALAWKLYCLRRLATSGLFPEFPADAAIYWGWAHLIRQNGWVGTNPFFLAPLYPYGLALLFAVHDSLLTVLAVQCVLGAASAVLIAATARSMSSPFAAIVVGVLAAGYRLSTLFDVSILSESVLWFLGCLFLYWHLRERQSLSAAFSVVAGVIIGLMSLARPSFVVLTLAHGAAAARLGGGKRSLRSMLIAATCIAALCLPTLVRHIALGYGPIAVTYSFGYNFYLGNSAVANGAYVNVVDDARDRLGETHYEGGIDQDGRRALWLQDKVALSPGQSSAYWLSKAIEDIRASPLHFLRLLWFKTRLSLNHKEAFQLDNLDVQERILGPYGIPFAGTFGFIACLGLSSILVRPGDPRARFLYAYLLCVWVPLIVFFVTDRYCIHLVPPLLVACAPIVDDVAALIRDRTRPRAYTPGRVGLMGLVVFAVMYPAVRYDRDQAAFETHRAVAEEFIKAGKLPEAEQELRRSVDPRLIGRLPLAEMRSARTAVASVYQALGDLCVESGRYAEGEQALGTAAAYAPDVRDIKVSRMLCHALMDSTDRALDECRALELSRQEAAHLLLRSAVAEASTRSWPRAERSLRAAVAMDSTNEEANVVLIRLLRTQGREGEARSLWATLPRKGISAKVVAREGTALGLK